MQEVFELERQHILARSQDRTKYKHLHDTTQPTSTVRTETIVHEERNEYVQQRPYDNMFDTFLAAELLEEMMSPPVIEVFQPVYVAPEPIYVEPVYQPSYDPTPAYESPVRSYDSGYDSGYSTGNSDYSSTYGDSGGSYGRDSSYSDSSSFSDSSSW